MKIVLDMKSIWLQRGDVYEKNNSRQNIRTNNGCLSGIVLR